MAEKTTTRSALSSLARALSLEVGKLELLRTTAWLILSIAVGVVGLGVALRGSVVGVFGLAFGAIGVGWFATIRFLLLRDKWNPILGVGTMILENAAPWAFYCLVAVAGSAQQAHHDWGPVFLYCGGLVVGMLKLSPRYSLLMGLIGGALYLLATVAVVMPLHPDNSDREFTVGGEATRAMFFIGSGSVVAWVTKGLRGAVGGVVSAIRASDLFGKYRLEKELAQGGMGVVWRATYCPEGGFERPAAVKLVHAHLAKDQEFVDAFRREAALGARLVHAHIVQTFDFGVVDSRYFLAMEFVDGPTLRDVMHRLKEQQQTMPPAIAAAVTQAVLAALQFAHGEARDSNGALLRVIHRDLAPTNILIAKSGAVKLTDFGIARALRDRDREETQTVAGHFDHMAPEQANAAPLDERTDLFCVGILLWEMLCGRPLFKRTNDPATLLAVSFGEIPAPSTIDLRLASWDAVVMKALDREPSGRFNSAEEMAEAVRAVGGEAGEDAIARFLSSLNTPLATSAPAPLSFTVPPLQDDNTTQIDKRRA